MAGGDDEKVAVKHPLNLCNRHVVHVSIVLGIVQLVYEDAVRELNGDLVLVHRDFFDVVSAFDTDFLFRNQVLQSARYRMKFSERLERRRWLQTCMITSVMRSLNAYRLSNLHEIINKNDSYVFLIYEGLHRRCIFLWRYDVTAVLWSVLHA